MAKITFVQRTSEYYPWVNVDRTKNVMHENTEGQNIQIETTAAITTSNQLAVFLLDAKANSQGGFSYDGSTYIIWKK